MALDIYLIFLFVLGEGKFSSGIKFSAESFAEISILAEKGKTHLESLREKANVPQFGPCWKNAISDLQIGCKFLSENVQSDLALRFTDCFLQMSGHEPLICDQPKSACLKKLSDRAFNAYTEFYTHTQSICYFLQSQIWHEETEKTIDKLSSTSHQVSQKLEEAGEIQEKLLNQQKESLLLQHDLNNSSKNVASVLQLSQDKINIFMKDFQITAEEQKELLLKLFENFLLFKSWAVSELTWINSTVYFVTAIILSFLITSVSRTREARISLFLIFAFNYFLERLFTSSLNSVFGDNFTVAPESLNSWIWLCRKFCICLGILILLYTAFNYYDYNALNYQLLLEIKNQNLKILNHFAFLANNQSINSTPINKLSEISNAFIHSSSGSKSLNNNMTFLHRSNEYHQPKLRNSLMPRLHSFSPIDESPNFSHDFVDSEERQEESKTQDKVSITSETESPSNNLKSGYNLRSIKSRKTTFC